MKTAASRQHDETVRTCETCGHCGLERTDYPCRCCVRTHGQVDMYKLDEGRVQRALHQALDVLRELAARADMSEDGEYRMVFDDDDDAGAPAETAY